jgi:SAM-dependent methyltransferase
MDELDDLLREQAAYYGAFAGDYDLAYDRADLLSLDSLTDGLPVAGEVLELACGTGQWTGLLAGRGHRVTAVDGAEEMLRRARERAAGPGVEFIRADLFNWTPPRRFDTVFFGFWLSHVPSQRFAEFWNLVGAALRPTGRACFIDSGTGDRAGEEILVGQPAPAVHRRLTDGSARRVVKVFRDPAELERALHGLGWMARVWPVGDKLIAGHAAPPR